MFWNEQFESRSRGFSVLVLLLALLPLKGFAQQAIPDAVLDIFEEKCAVRGCHTGSSAPKGLDLTEEYAFSSLVNVPSHDNSRLMRVKPQDPVNSYLMLKITDSPLIRGARMPKRGKPLSQQEIATIETWIKSLQPGTRVQAPPPEYVEAFPGLSLSTLPTTETLERGVFSYRIAHRWRGKVDEGFANLFGLDFGAHMFTQLAFPVTNDVTVAVGRSATNATFEFSGKWRFLREKTDGSMPISAAIHAGVDWATRKEIADPNNPNRRLSRTDGERFAWFAQLVLSKKVHERVSLLLVPGILANGNVNLLDEDPIFTLGFGGKIMLFRGFSIFVEGVPILSGDDGANPVGGPRLENGKAVINDAFTIGFERKVGGHVFHVYVTNSLGLATGQYMSGANFDFADGDFRLGFNIYRSLRLPF
ncbi:MAG: hypothetical protein D6743_11860 [Calditrichaeota bacterium]|nr:MAG: hypothetical protein D6743_11860 [Calditrichota bacterium]